MLRGGFRDDKPLRDTQARSFFRFLPDEGKPKMQTAEIDDVRQARRYRLAQYNARPTTLTVDGMTITGTVLSVMEDPLASPTRWIVKIAERAKRPSS